MLQQTQVKTVIPYFNNFVKEVPSLKILSLCNEKKILKLWEGLGYYRRAKNLHKTAKILVQSYKTKLPKKFEELIKLPGIGEYTANVLLALVYNQSRIPIDGNVKRVFSRLFNKYKETDKKKINKLFDTNRNSDLVEALMEFGAVICKPKNPLCNVCNLKKNCQYFNNKISNLINKKRSIKEKKYNIYCYLKKQKKEIALTRNKKLSFLSNFKIPEAQILASKHNSNKKGWIYLCNYKNNISNIKMNINLFYKFTNNKPKKFTWYSLNQSSNEFIPSFTKKIIQKVTKLYI